jgi:beta-galactosidase
VALGADGVCYFQWRAGLGASEKYHGAVLSHTNTTDTRVFREVRTTGEHLDELASVLGGRVRAEAAVIYDVENRWALEGVHGLKDAQGGSLVRYEETCVEHYRPLWAKGIATDVIAADADFSPYRLILAPMLYMLRPGVAEKLSAWVERGGVLVLTYLTGQADEHDLCFLGGAPGPLRPLCGLWVEETDCVQAHERQEVVFPAGGRCDIVGEFPAFELCQILRLEDAEPVAMYTEGHYAGMPAITRRRQGAGETWYVGARLAPTGLAALIDSLVDRVSPRRALRSALPPGVVAHARDGAGGERVWLMNCHNSEQAVDLRDDQLARLAEPNKPLAECRLPAYGVEVFVRLSA